MLQDWKANLRTVVGGLTFFYFIFMFPGLVAALQTALVRTSDGDVYQIRFRNRNPIRGIYYLGDFVDDFSIYDRAGRVRLCPSNDEKVTWELYTAARILAKTPRNTRVFNTSALVAALEQAVEDQDLTPKKILEKELVGEIKGEIQSHTFLKSLNVVPKSGPIAVIEIPATLISKLGNLEIKIRRLLYAFWIASGHANTAIALQEAANQRAAELWDSVNAGRVIDIFGGDLNVDIESSGISGNVSVDGPLRLRLAAEVYQENAERAAELGTDLGKSENAWRSWLVGLTGIGDILQLLASPISAHQLKNALENLEDSSGDKIASSMRLNIERIYDSAASNLNRYGFCSPRLEFNWRYFDVYEGYSLTYTVALSSPTDSVTTVAISSDNSDATVSPDMLTFSPGDWYKPKRVMLHAAEDADNVNDRVSLSHNVSGYGDNLIGEVGFDIIDRKGNEFPESVGRIPPLSLPLGDDYRLDLAGYFRDPENAALIYGAEETDYKVGVVRILSDRTGSWITIRPRKIGSTTVTVWVIDPGDLSARQTFTVTVGPPAPVENDAPQPVGTIPPQMLTVGSSSPLLNLSDYFRDPGDTLRYTAESGNRSVARVLKIGSQTTISAHGIGSTTVTATVTDSGGLQAFQRIAVTVRAPLDQDPTVITPTPPSQGLERGNTVVVQNTASSVLNIRGGAGLGWGEKGAASDGATGTIIDGPRQANGYTWWKVRWDPSNKIRWTHQPANNSGWSVEAVGSTGYLASRPPAPVVQSFDLAIQSFTVNKTSLTPGENFTLNFTIRNNGPGESVAPGLSYYHSSLQGRSPTDPPRLQGTVSLDSIAPGKSTTKSIRLNAPSTPKTYYYGGWLTANTGDTDIYNDVATEVGVTVTDSPNQTSSNSPDLVIESISANKVVLVPGEAFRLDTVVRNQGKVDASSTYLRYYRSSDSTISPNDTEVGDDRMTTPDARQTYDKWERLTAPDTPGVYYYGACVDSVTDEINTLNNCSEAIEITVQIARPPDLVIESVSADKVSLDPNDRFKLTAIVRNQGEVGASSTKLRYYLSSDAIISLDDDTEVDTRNVRSLEEDEISEGLKTLRAPDTPGVYYYGACVDSVTGESDVNNNCSEAIEITVQPPPLPDLIVESISVSNDPLVPGESFTLSVTVRNNGTSKSYSTWLRYHGPGGHEIGKNRVDRLSPTIVSNQNINLEAPDEVGTYYYEACVDSVHGETEVHNNCSTRIAITVGTPANRVPALLGAITARSLTAGGSSAQMDLSGYFRDPDDDRLTYSVSSDVTRIATVSVSGSQITITPKSAGIATITVTASDGTLMATQRFSVTVTAATVGNRAPVTVGTISPRTLAVDDRSERIYVSGYFRDPDDDRLTYIASSDDTQVATVSVSGSQVAITPEDTGTALVAVTASDGELTATQRFSVTVTAVPVGNRAPVTVGAISPRMLTVGNPPERIYVSGYFRDPDNDNLVYTVRSDNTGVATVNVSGAQITITAQDVGSAIVTVTASDGALTVTQDFTVTGTNDRPSPIELPPTHQGICDRTLQVLNQILTEIGIDDCADVENNDLSAVTSLQLSKAGITTLKESDFKNLNNLKELYLTKNSLRSLPVDVFEGLSDLEKLVLYGNSLESLPTDIFDGLSALTHLDLGGNSLRTLPADVFSGLSALETLSLNNNRLESLPVNIFNGLNSLERLSLSGQLTTFTKGVFDDLLDTLSDSRLSVNPAAKATIAFNSTLQEAVEGETVRVTVSLSHALPVAVRVPYSVGGTTTEVDYNLQTQKELLFLADETSKEIVFELLEDTDTAVETITVTLNDLDDIRLRKSDGTGTDSGLHSSVLLNLSNSRVHNITVTSDNGGGVTDRSGVTNWMYWTDHREKISRSKLDGTQVQVLVADTGDGTIALDVSGGKMYWTSDGKIQRANLDGTEIEDLFYSSSYPSGIALDVSAGKMYWTRGSKIQRANLDGSQIEELSAGHGSLDAIALDVPGGKMYWIDGRGDKIRRSNLDGSQIEDLVTGRDVFGNNGIALDVSRGKMYWIRGDNILRANLNGSQVEEVVDMRSSYNFYGIALDVSGNKMYWTHGPKIRCANIDGSQIKDLVTDLSSPHGIALAVGSGAAANAAPSAVSTNSEPRLLSETALLPNYPNPFNPETWIPYRLAKPADVSISIYAADGMLVRTLGLGHRSVGLYESRSRAAYWDGKNALGEPVASGVYFYTLSAGEFSATRKMLIRK